MSQASRPDSPERLASIVLEMQEAHPRPVVHFKRRYYFARDGHNNFAGVVAYPSEKKRLIKAGLLVRVRRRFYLSPLGLDWAQRSLRQLVAWLEIEIERQRQEELAEKEKG